MPWPPSPMWISWRVTAKQFLSTPARWASRGSYPSAVHVMVPIERGMTHDQAHGYCKRIAERLAASEPDRYTTSAVMAKRPGRLFIDYLRNGRGTTGIGT